MKGLMHNDNDLRYKIIAMVKQSAALNRPGAENLKPRQLYGAISKVMGQISESGWEIIRSADGIKSEIEDTMQSICSKLLNPSGKDMQTPTQRMGYSRSYTVPSNETNAVFNNEQKETLVLTPDDADIGMPPSFPGNVENDTCHLGYVC
ncbi:hypothetical protein ACJRO7_004607 [Eucalyptus globulus]|uniref:Uncharacterized protein n=1 Tax=Eucalyptus globulus TaxID=34317 RepID=A0ABD3IZH4_EUCGL